MLFKNPDSKRKNPFMDIYNNEKFKSVLQYKENPRIFPFIVDVELTNYCNLNCIFCGQQTMKRPKGYISEEIFKKIVDECAEHKTPIRFIRWGEPFLHPKIIEFSRYVKSKGLPLHITNNGLAMKESDILDLIDLKLDSLIFSFQGATKEQYEIMRNNNRYEELKAKVLKFVELRGNNPKPFIQISSTMTNETEEQIKDFVDYWEKIVDLVTVGKTNLSRLSAQQIKSFENIGKLELLKKQETIKKIYRPCTEIYSKLSVDWDGKVTGCCSDYDNFLVVGDLNKSNLFDIWNNSRELKIFRELLNNNKHKCLTLCSTCYHTYEEF